MAENKTQELTFLEKVKEMLIKNHNIILHGAPGTGKTYLAQKIAEKMGATKKNGQFKMVQFHPSYDYTDFVEGLRPTDKNEAGEVVKDIHFVRTDGIFKEFCKKAVAVKPIITEELLKQAWDNLISGDISSFKSKIGKDLKVANKNENKITFFGEEKEEGNDVSWQRLLKLHKKYPSLESVETIEKIEDIKDPDKGIGGCDASKYWAVLYYLYKSIVPSFIFLIDEINRGDMSKIFGELFFSIDPGYRGKDGKIPTQYQNLITKTYKDKDGKEVEDPFYEGFHVPANVYIIGTMNDIDRSVESMDFAMRRRFQFIEVTAENRAEGMGLIERDAEGNITKTEAYKRMTNLNNCISSKVEDGGIGLSSAYHIGGSYFLKDKKVIADGNDQDFKDLWNYRLEGLLREYLRGEDESEAKAKLDKLKDAFGIDKDGNLKDVATLVAPTN